jgi:ABC-type lipoprotein export system ATPase subunit
VSQSSSIVASCRDLVRSYWTESGRVDALRGVSISFSDSAVTAVMGPSGSGKSTLLRLLAGLDRPDSGGVTIAGVEVDRLSARGLRDLRRHKVAYVFQRPSDNFVPHLRVVDHLHLAAHDGVDRDGLGRVLERLGISGRADRLPNTLSGGEQQRAALGQALVSGARLIVADEPTAELDDESSERLLTEISGLAAEGVAFVLATHDHRVASFADHVVEILDGRVRGPGGQPVPAIARPATSRNGDTGIAISKRYLATPAHMRRSPVQSVAPPSTRPAASHGVSPLVRVTGLVKRYRRGPELVHAVEDIDLALRPGSIVGLMGRSGSGKTTLLNLLAGWEHPDEGTVWVDESLEPHGVVASWSTIALLPQRLGVIDELSVRQNVEYPARLAGRLAESSARVDELLDRLRLKELQHRPPTEISLGQRQRAAFARAILLAPRLVLADEPTSNQDSASARVVIEMIKEESKRGSAFLIATHNDEVARTVDEIVIMDDGRIVSREG